MERRIENATVTSPSTLLTLPHFLPLFATPSAPLPPSFSPSSSPLLPLFSPSSPPLPPLFLHLFSILYRYSILNFQDPRFQTERMPIKSFIWDIHNPNTPEQELTPASPLCCLRFNPKQTDTLVGGSYNGLVRGKEEGE